MKKNRQLWAFLLTLLVVCESLAWAPIIRRRHWEESSAATTTWQTFYGSMTVDTGGWGELMRRMDALEAALSIPEKSPRDSVVSEQAVWK